MKLAEVKQIKRAFVRWGLNLDHFGDAEMKAATYLVMLRLKDLIKLIEETEKEVE